MLFYVLSAKYSLTMKYILYHFESQRRGRIRDQNQQRCSLNTNLCSSSGFLQTDFQILSVLWRVLHKSSERRKMVGRAGDMIPGAYAPGYFLTPLRGLIWNYIPHTVGSLPRLMSYAPMGLVFQLFSYTPTGLEIEIIYLTVGYTHG